jgi:sugar phosphate isomerase/epimerase
MIGVHLHDVRGLDDHLAPRQGELDYNAIKPFIKPSIIPVLEVHHKVKRKVLLEGIRTIKQAIFQKS